MDGSSISLMLHSALSSVCVCVCVFVGMWGVVAAPCTHVSACMCACVDICWCEANGWQFSFVVLHPARVSQCACVCVCADICWCVVNGSRYSFDDAASCTHVTEWSCV